MPRAAGKQPKPHTDCFTWTDETLKRKLPVDNQMQSIAQEELEIKKKLITRMEKVGKENSNQMGRPMTNKEKLTGSKAEGFCYAETDNAAPTTATNASSLSAPPVLSYCGTAPRVW